MYGYERVAGDLDSDAELNRTVTELRNRLYEPVSVRR
jgi:hypothetical protein